MINLYKILDEIENTNDIMEISKSLKMVKDSKEKVKGADLWKLGFAEEALLNKREEIVNNSNKILEVI